MNEGTFKNLPVIFVDYNIILKPNGDILLREVPASKLKITSGDRFEFIDTPLGTVFKKLVL
jgi:hypothetical protein